MLGTTSKISKGIFTEQGTLTMGGDGEITITGNDYGIDDNGIVLTSGTDDEGPNALKFRDSYPNGTQRGAILADSSTSDMIFNATNGYDLQLTSSGTGDIDITTLNDIDITAGGVVDISSARITLKSYTRSQILALSSPNEGTLVWNSTAGRGAYYDGTDWRHLNNGSTI